ncbi:cell adhesion molecule CEACAM15-like [Leptodactylus fuscus]|uniref:cell adhesion molecule CEACAM15-like n=1 Tax=Leptodactylus fuscus TaxID=238119 RepID=UPI003F4ECC03
MERFLVLMEILFSFSLSALLGTIQLIPQYPAINGSVILSVTGNNERILSFSWYKGPSTSSEYQILRYVPSYSSIIIQGPLYSPRFSVLNNGSLQIKDLRMTDGGGYIARIQTETSVKEIHVSLTVYELVTKPIITSSHHPVREGDFYVLACVTANAEKITWMRLNKNFPEGAEISADSRTVTFNDFKHIDVGEYQCEAENLVSTKVSDIFSVGYHSGSSPSVIAGIVCGTVLIIVLILCATYLLYTYYILPSRMAQKDPCRSAFPPPNKTNESGKPHGKYF